MEKKIDLKIEELAPELKELTLKIHNNPELGGEKFKACQWQKELLEKYGFEVENGFCDIPTAYKAVYKGAKEGPRIAMLAEYDALPELGHGCGHNLIAMVSVGAGLVMKDLADEFGGEIYVIGTPAEETKGAKVEMSEKGAFKDMDVAMMAHPQYLSAESVNTQAIIAIKVEFFGKTAHAAMRQQISDDSRIHGVITNGGVAPNIIPDYTSAVFYVRAKRFADALALKERVVACAEGAALGTGCTCKVSKTEEDFKDTCSNMCLSDLATAKAEALGEYILRLGGKTMPGSSDLGNVSYECPAIQLGFKIGDPADGNYASCHTKEFCEAAGSEEGMNAALKYVKVFALTGLDLMTKPELLEAIKEEFSHVNAPKPMDIGF